MPKLNQTAIAIRGLALLASKADAAMEEAVIAMESTSDDSIVQTLKHLHEAEVDLAGAQIRLDQLRRAGVL